MKINFSRPARRLFILLNYLFLISMTGFYELALDFHKQDLFLILAGVSFILLAITFTVVYVRTGLWSFAHRKFSMLDEREVQVSLSSLRYAYAIFTVIALIIIYLVSVFEVSLSILLAAAMVYLAHILPASIIAWNSR